MGNINKQMAYSQWATSQWIDFIYNTDDSDQYLRRLISHIVKGERAWLERILKSDWNKDLWIAEDKPAILLLFEANRRMLQQILQKDLTGRMSIQRLNGQSYNPTLADILQHIFFHGENHRGQLAYFSARAGLTYPATDYMRYCILQQL